MVSFETRLHTNADESALVKLRRMFCRQINKIALRRRFEDRVWRRNESFNDYVHEKVIMANRLAMPEDETL